MIIDVYYGDGDHNIKRDNARGIRTYIEYMWERCQDIGLSPIFQILKVGERWRALSPSEAVLTSHRYHNILHAR